jgi:hypothetical protein
MSIVYTIDLVVKSASCRYIGLWMINAEYAVLDDPS